MFIKVFPMPSWKRCLQTNKIKQFLQSWERSFWSWDSGVVDKSFVSHIILWIFVVPVCHCLWTFPNLHQIPTSTRSQIQTVLDSNKYKAKQFKCLKNAVRLQGTRAQFNRIILDSHEYILRCMYSEATIFFFWWNRRNNFRLSRSNCKENTWLQMA